MIKRESDESVRMVVTPFGINTSLFYDNHVIHDDIVVGTVKKMDKKYGIDYLIRSFAQAYSHLKLHDAEVADKMKLMLVGPGEQTDELKDLALELGIADRTTFVGRVMHDQVPVQLASWIFGNFFRMIKLPFGMESALFVFSFFQFGIILTGKGIDDYIAVIRNNRIVAVSLVIMMMAVVCFLSEFNGPTQVKSIMFGRSIIAFLATSILGIIAVVILSVLAENTRWLQYVGQQTLPILLMHKFPILFFQMIIRPVGRLLEQGDSVAGIICSVIVGAITVALCLIANTILKRVFPIAVGVLPHSTREETVHIIRNNQAERNVSQPAKSKKSD